MDMNPEDIPFPRTETLKIISQDLVGMETRLNTRLEGFDISNKVTVGNKSSKGTYVTYNVDITFKSLESMRNIYQRLSEIEGVARVI